MGAVCDRPVMVNVLWSYHLAFDVGAVCGRPIMVNVLWSYHLLVDHIRVSGTWIIVRKLIGSMGEVRRRPVPSVSSTTSNDSILSNGRPWIVSARGRHTKLRSQVGKGAGERFLGRSRCRHKSANTRKTNQLQTYNRTTETNVHQIHTRES